MFPFPGISLHLSYLTWFTFNNAVKNAKKPETQNRWIGGRLAWSLGLSYVPLSYFPGIPFPDGRFPGNPGKPGKYKFVAVYINNWQQTPTFLTFCIQTHWEREKYCKTSTRAMLQYPVPSTSTLYNPVCSTQAKLARNRDKLFLIKQSLLAHAFRSFQCSF